MLSLAEKEHDYYLQFTGAHPNIGGLLGATPSEGVTWGKIDLDARSDTVVCYGDSTVALPPLSAYAVAHHAKHPHRRL